MLQTNRSATPGELKVFGLLLALFFGIIGGLALWKSGALAVASIFWGFGGLVAALYYTLPPIRRVLYRAWMATFFPIGWLVSHLILAVAYYLVFTPVGWIMRLIGRDPMQRKFDYEAATYWGEHPSTDQRANYFKQF